MWALIGDFISGTVETIIAAWESIKEVKWVARGLQWFSKFERIACAIQWAGWLQGIALGFDILKFFGLRDNEILDRLGISNVVSNEESLRKFLRTSSDQIKPALHDTKLLERELFAPPSGLNGIHKPPYHSIAIHEVVYEFSNLLGYGNMIIIFNPEGFGAKPKAPQIVRYVSEKEFGEFLSSESWGNYWRVNYLLGLKKRNKQVNRYTRSKNLLTDEERIQPQTEGLDQFIERALDLDDESSKIIAREFNQQINYAMEKNIFFTDLMKEAIENGSIGRGIEKDIRITDQLGRVWNKVPDNLTRIIRTNPVFKDVIKVSGTYKKEAARFRSLTDRFNSAGFTRTLENEALTLFKSLGARSSLLNIFKTISSVFVKESSVDNPLTNELRDIGLFRQTKGEIDFLSGKAGGIKVKWEEYLANPNNTDISELADYWINTTNELVDVLTKNEDTKLLKALDNILEQAGQAGEGQVIDSAVESLNSFFDLLKEPTLKDYTGGAIKSSLKPPTCNPLTGAG